MPPLNLIYTLHYLKLRALDIISMLEFIYYATYSIRFWWHIRHGNPKLVDETVQRVAGDWAARMMRRYGCVMRIEGLENVPGQGAVIVMVNHQSQYDIPILMANLGRLLGFIAKKELFQIPGLSYWMRRLNCISIDRSDRAGAAKLFATLSRHIKDTQSGIIVFPEGTRNRNPEGDIQSFKEGSLRLATLENIPILPVSIDGSRHFARSELLYRTRNGGRLVRMKIAPLVNSRVGSSLERRALMARVRETIESNFNAIRVDWPAESGRN